MVHYLQEVFVIEKYNEDIVISATELKLNLGKYLGMAADKKDVVITRNNVKITRLTPYITDIESYFTAKENAHDYVYGGKKVSYAEFMQIYEKSSGVKEYWIVDNKSEHILIYSFKDFNIDMVRVFNLNETAESFCFKGLRCNTKELFELE